MNSKPPKNTKNLKVVLNRKSSSVKKKITITKKKSKGNNFTLQQPYPSEGFRVPQSYGEQQYQLLQPQLLDNNHYFQGGQGQPNPHAQSYDQAQMQRMFYDNYHTLEDRFRDGARLTTQDSTHMYFESGITASGDGDNISRLLNADIPQLPDQGLAASILNRYNTLSPVSRGPASQNNFVGNDIFDQRREQPAHRKSNLMQYQNNIRMSNNLKRKTDGAEKLEMDTNDQYNSQMSSMFKKPPKPRKEIGQTAKNTMIDTDNRDSITREITEIRVSSQTPAKQRLSISRRNSERSIRSRQSQSQEHLIEDNNTTHKHTTCEINYKIEPDINDDSIQPQVDQRFSPESDTFTENIQQINSPHNNRANETLSRSNYKSIMNQASYQGVLEASGEVKKEQDMFSTAQYEVHEANSNQRKRTNTTLLTTNRVREESLSQRAAGEEGAIKRMQDHNGLEMRARQEATSERPHQIEYTRSVTIKSSTNKASSGETPQQCRSPKWNQTQNATLERGSSPENEHDDPIPQGQSIQQQSPIPTDNLRLDAPGSQISESVGPFQIVQPNQSNRQAQDGNSPQIYFQGSQGAPNQTPRTSTGIVDYQEIPLQATTTIQTQRISIQNQEITLPIPTIQRVDEEQKLNSNNSRKSRASKVSNGNQSTSNKSPAQRSNTLPNTAAPINDEIQENDQTREHSNQLLGDRSRKTASQHNYRKTYTKVDFANESHDYLHISNTDGQPGIRSHAGSGNNSGRSRGRQLSSNQSKHAYTVHTFGKQDEEEKDGGDLKNLDSKNHGLGDSSSESGLGRSNTFGEIGISPLGSKQRGMKIIKIKTNYKAKRSEDEASSAKFQDKNFESQNSTIQATMKREYGEESSPSHSMKEVPREENRLALTHSQLKTQQIDNFSDLQTKQNSAPNKKPEDRLPDEKAVDIEKTEQESFTPRAEEKQKEEKTSSSKNENPEVHQQETSTILKIEMEPEDQAQQKEDKDTNLSLSIRNTIDQINDSKKDEATETEIVNCYIPGETAWDDIDQKYKQYAESVRISKDNYDQSSGTLVDSKSQNCQIEDQGNLQSENWTNIEKPEESNDQSSTKQQLQQVRGDLKLALNEVDNKNNFRNYSFENDSSSGMESTERVKDASPISKVKSSAKQKRDLFKINKKVSVQDIGQKSPDFDVMPTSPRGSDKVILEEQEKAKWQSVIQANLQMSILQRMKKFEDKDKEETENEPRSLLSMLPNIRDVNKESEIQSLSSPKKEVMPEPQVVEDEENQRETEAAFEPKVEIQLENPIVEDVLEVKETAPEEIQPEVQFNEHENQLFDEINQFESLSKQLNFENAFPIHKDIFGQLESFNYEKFTEAKSARIDKIADFCNHSIGLISSKTDTSLKQFSCASLYLRDFSSVAPVMASTSTEQARESNKEYKIEEIFYSPDHLKSLAKVYQKDMELRNSFGYQSLNQEYTIKLNSPKLARRQSLNKENRREHAPVIPSEAAMMRRNMSIPVATRDTLRVTAELPTWQEESSPLERPISSQRNGIANRLPSSRSRLLSHRSKNSNLILEGKSSELDRESVVTMSKIEKKKNTQREGSKLRQSKMQINVIKDELSSANPFGPAIENVDAQSNRSEDKNSESNSQPQEGSVYSDGSSDEEEDLYDDFKIHEMMDLQQEKYLQGLTKEPAGSNGTISLVSLDGVEPSSNDQSGITVPPSPLRKAKPKAHLKYRITSQQELDELEKELKGTHKFYTQKPLNLLASCKAYDIITANHPPTSGRAPQHTTNDIIEHLMIKQLQSDFERALVEVPSAVQRDQIQYLTTHRVHFISVKEDLQEEINQLQYNRFQIMLNSKTKVSNIKPIKVKKKKKPEPAAAQASGRAVTLGSQSIGIQSDKFNTPIKKVSVNKLANIQGTLQLQLDKHIHTNFKSKCAVIKELTPQQLAAKEEVHKFFIMFNLTRNTIFRSNEFLVDKDDEQNTRSFLVQKYQDRGIQVSRDELIQKISDQTLSQVDSIDVIGKKLIEIFSIAQILNSKMFQVFFLRTGVYYSIQLKLVWVTKDFMKFMNRFDRPIKQKKFGRIQKEPPKFFNYQKYVDHQKHKYDSIQREGQTIKYELNMENQTHLYNQEFLFNKIIYRFMHNSGDPIRDLKAVIFQNKLDLVRNRIKENHRSIRDIYYCDFQERIEERLFQLITIGRKFRDLRYKVEACLEHSIFQSSSSEDEGSDEKQRQVYQSPHYMEFVLINDIETSRYKGISLMQCVKQINPYIKLFRGTGVIDFRERIDEMQALENERTRKVFIAEQEQYNKPYIHIDSEDEDFYEDDYPKFQLSNKFSYVEKHQRLGFYSIFYTEIEDGYNEDPEQYPYLKIPEEGEHALALANLAVKTRLKRLNYHQKIRRNLVVKKKDPKHNLQYKVGESGQLIAVPVNLNKSVGQETRTGHGHKKVVFKFIEKEGAYESHQGFRTTATNLKEKSEQFCCRDLEEEQLAKNHPVKRNSTHSDESFQSSSFRSDSEKESAESAEEILIQPMKEKSQLTALARMDTPTLRPRLKSHGLGGPKSGGQQQNIKEQQKCDSSLRKKLQYVYDQFTPTINSTDHSIAKEDLKKPLKIVDELSFEESATDAEADACYSDWNDYSIMVQKQGGSNKLAASLNLKSIDVHEMQSLYDKQEHDAKLNSNLVNIERHSEKKEFEVVQSSSASKLRYSKGVAANQASIQSSISVTRRGTLVKYASHEMAEGEVLAHSHTRNLVHAVKEAGTVAGLLSSRSKASSKFKLQQGPLHITDIVSDGDITKRHWSMQDIKEHSQLANTINKRIQEIIVANVDLALREVMDEINEVDLEHSEHGSKSSVERAQTDLQFSVQLLRIPTMHSEIESKLAPHMQLNLTNIKAEDSDRMITPSIFSPIIHDLDENPQTVLKNDMQIMQDAISIDQFANPLSEIQSPLATRDRALSFNDKKHNSTSKPLLFDKFEKVEDQHSSSDYDGETEVLHEHSHHGCEEEPGERLELWSPEGLATDCAQAQNYQALQRSRTIAKLPLRGRLFGNTPSKRCFMQDLSENIHLKLKQNIEHQYSIHQKEHRNLKRLKKVLQSKKVRFDDEDIKRKRKALEANSKVLVLLQQFYVVDEKDKTNYMLRGKTLFIHFVKKVIFVLKMNEKKAVFAFRDIAKKAAGTVARQTMSAVNKDKIFQAIVNNQTTIISDFCQYNVLLIDMQNEDGYTLLAFATHHGYFNIVDVLLRAGANPNIPTSDFKGSNTPLHIAANYGFKKIQDLLIENHADEKKVNQFGMTPWEGFVPSDEEHAMQGYVLAKERFGELN